MEEEKDGKELEEILDHFRKISFEDEDFLFLFKDEYDSLDETERAPLHVR